VEPLGSLLQANAEVARKFALGLLGS
jgi:hypothetical protein